LRGNTGIGQCAKKHVAADAGKTIEIGYSHKRLVVGRSSLASAAGSVVDVMLP